MAMASANIKTSEDLKALIAEHRDSAWSLMKELSRTDAAMLRNYGYRNMTNAEAMKAHFDGTCALIEKRIQKFERENPR